MGFVTRLMIGITTLTILTAGNSSVVIDGVALKDKSVINGVTLVNAKIGKTRVIHATQESTFNSNIETVYQITKMFDKKCNNDYKSKREFTDKNTVCVFPNENLIESITEKNIKKQYTPLPNEIERYIVKRRIYNTQTLSHNDLIIIKKYNEKDGKQVYEVIHQMISEKETKKYIDNPINEHSAFKEMVGTYKIIAIDKDHTKVIYTYLSKTDHWMLRGDMLVNKIYNNTAKGTILALKGIENGIKMNLVKN